MSPKSKGSDTSSTPQAAPAAAIGNDMADAGNMDKIRDILFGNQARDYENRFVQMEQQVSQEIAELKAEMLKRIDALENYIKQEVKDLNERIKNESSERSNAIKTIERDIKDGFETLDKKLLNDEENLARKSTELREQILEQSKTLTDEILAKYEQNSTNLKQAAQQLDDAKVNRSDLSGFFLEIAMRLSGDELPGSS